MLCFFVKKLIHFKPDARLSINEFWMLTELLFFQDLQRILKIAIYVLQVQFAICNNEFAIYLF